MKSTADRVLDALEAYRLTDQGHGKYRADCPWRAGSDSLGLGVTITDGEHGAFFDHVSDEQGSLYELADRLGVEHPGVTQHQQPFESKRSYNDLADYARSKGLDRGVFLMAGWSDRTLVREGQEQRPALSFATDSGIKYRFIDGKKPVFKPKQKGYLACWYKLSEAVALAEQHNQPLVICNGEPSTVVAQHWMVAATAMTGGENKTIRPDWIEELRRLYNGPILVALDCDNAGRAGARKWYDALLEAGYQVRALDLNGGTGFDLADFCMLHQHESASALQLLSDLAIEEPLDVAIVDDTVQVPPLPDYAAVNNALAAAASPWLDDYIAFSRYRTPRSYDGFHEACALWVLSTIAARRVAIDYSGLRYTNLYIAFCAPTSLYAKTEAAKIALEVIHEGKFFYLLAPDDATPQAFLRGLTVRVPEGFALLDEARQKAIEYKLAFAAQKGWFYDEFGQKLNGMMRDAGTMADYRGHLRRLDDCPPQYEYSTIGRGNDFVERPYLALLASLTPADLKPHARKGAALWGDGFLARFALIGPAAGESFRRDDFPDGESSIPYKILHPLQQWHQRLGIPRITIEERTDEKGKKTGFFNAAVEERPPQICTFGEGVREAVKHYNHALLDLIEADSDQMGDLAGSYIRFHNKALRIAMLLASLENNGRIELCHWARAQQIVERWRANLHQIVGRLAEDEPTFKRHIEDRILEWLQAHEGWHTARVISQYIRRLSSKEAADALESMVEVGIVESRPSTNNKTTEYRAIPRVQRRRVDSVDMQTQPKPAYTPQKLETAVTQAEGVDTSAQRLQVCTSAQNESPNPKHTTSARSCPNADEIACVRSQLDERGPVWARQYMNETGGWDAYPTVIRLYVQKAEREATAGHT